MQECGGIYVQLSRGQRQSWLRQMTMKKILLSIHPAGMITDINLDVISERMELVRDWTPELHDARVSDASFVNIIVQLPAIGANEIRRLRKAFDNMPRMKACVWKDFGTEVQLDKVDKNILEAAAVAFSKI